MLTTAGIDKVYKQTIFHTCKQTAELSSKGVNKQKQPLLFKNSWFNYVNKQLAIIQQRKQSDDNNKYVNKQLIILH